MGRGPSSTTTGRADGGQIWRPRPHPPPDEVHNKAVGTNVVRRDLFFKKKWTNK